MTVEVKRAAVESDGWPSKILVVDDNPAEQLLMQATLEGIAGRTFELNCASSLSEARVLLADGLYDVVLVDYYLGDGYGIDLIREAAKEMGPPAILMTGFSSRRVDVDAMRAGAADFICKNDVTPSLLERSIRYAVERHRVARTLLDQQMQLERNYAELSTTKAQLEAQGESIAVLAAHLAGATGHPNGYDEITASDDHAVTTAYHRVGLCHLRRDGTIASIDETLRSILAAGTDPVGKPFGDMFPPQEQDRFRRASLLWANGLATTFEASIGGGDGGTPRRVALSGSPRKDDSGNVVDMLVTIVDITQRRNAEAQAHEMARRDPITRLMNRVALQEALPYVLANAARSERHVAVLYLDLDGFKAINDLLGHQGGDQILVTIAERLRRSVRTSDFAARQGGDEFVIILNNLTGFAGAAQAAKKILSRLAEPCTIDGHSISPRASIGIAMFPGDATEPEQLLRLADMALYRAKNGARGRFEFANPRMSRHTARRGRLECELHAAIERNELELFYQPQLAISDGDVQGFEALLRWRHPKRGLLAPGRFLALAETVGLMEPISQWVLEEACRQARTWQRSGLFEPCIAINLAASQLKRPRLPECLKVALDDAGLPPSALQIEITEDAVIDDLDHAHDLISGMRAIGLSVALDDFGTGYSSLTLLRRLPVNQLKIDRSFVHHVNSDKKNAAIVEATVRLGRRLGMDVVAEGVETVQELDYLRYIGCEHGQGFFFARPLPANDIVLGWLAITAGCQRISLLRECSDVRVRTRNGIINIDR